MSVCYSRDLTSQTRNMTNQNNRHSTIKHFGGINKWTLMFMLFFACLFSLKSQMTDIDWSNIPQNSNLDDYLTDTDLDGIPDFQDLDDDNDGILDTIECPITPDNNIFFDGFSGTSGHNKAPDNWNNINSPDLMTFSDDRSGVTLSNDSKNSGTLVFSDAVTGPFTTTEGIYKTIPGFEIGKSYFISFEQSIWKIPTFFDACDSGRWKVNLGGDVMMSPNMGTPTTIGENTVFTTVNIGPFIATNTSLELRMEAESGSSCLDGESILLLDGIKISEAPIECDTDNDGIINSLDTDSDNDGCSDAIEGGGSILRAQLDTNAQIIGTVDANGVPILVGSTGQTVGTSVDELVSAVECSLKSDATILAGFFPASDSVSYIFPCGGYYYTEAILKASGAETYTWDSPSGDMDLITMTSDSTYSYMRINDLYGYTTLVYRVMMESRNGMGIPQVDTVILTIHRERCSEMGGGISGVGVLEDTLKCGQDTISLVSKGGTSYHWDSPSGDMDLLTITSDSTYLFTNTKNVAGKYTYRVITNWTDPTCHFECHVAQSDTFMLTLYTKRCPTDLGVTKTDNTDYYTPNTTTEYTIVVKNYGPSDVVDGIVNDPLPIGISNSAVSWNAMVHGAAVSGVTGNQVGLLNDVVSIPVGDSIVYLVNIDIPVDFKGALINTVTVTSNLDTNAANNIATDIDQNICEGADSVSLIITNPPAGCKPVIIDITNPLWTVGSINTNTLTYFKDEAATTPFTTPETADAGAYYIVAISPIGCSDTAKINVNQNPNPDVILREDTTICEGENLMIDAGVFDTWNWIVGGEKTQTILVNSSNEYKVIVTNVYGCSDIDSVLITINPLPIVDLGKDTTLCINETIDIDAGNFGWNYIWNTTETSKTIINKSPGFYKVKVYNSFGCFKEDSINIHLELIPDPYLKKEFDICEGGSINLQPDNGFELYDISWPNLSTIPLLNVNGGGDYYSEVTGEYCSDTFKLTVTKIDTPDILILNPTEGGIVCFEDQIVRLQVTDQNPGINTYEWSTGELTTFIQVSEGGTYYVTAKNGACEAIQEIELKDFCLSALYIPNAFTPEHNGLNEIFIPKYTGEITNYEFLIFDRWGKQIFSTNNIHEGWDGTYKGNPCQIEVYVYKITYDYSIKIGSKKTKQRVGTVTLMR